MIKISRKLNAHEKEQLLTLQNKRRQKYGLPPLKTIKIEELITMPVGNNTPTKPKRIDGGMYQ